jgi:hypothetical protein
MNEREVLDTWFNGWLLWSVIYYATGFLAISLPAVLAAGFPTGELGKRKLAAVIAVLLAAITWLQPGYRATKKADGLACLRELIATNSYSDQGKFKYCADTFNYQYTDVQSEVTRR